MLYKHAKLHEQLAASGARARGELLKVMHEGAAQTGSRDMDAHRSAWWNYKLTIRVLPEGEQPFEATVRTRWFCAAGMLHGGAFVEVLYDPADHSRVVVDYERALQDQQEQRETDAARRGQLEAMTETLRARLVTHGVDPQNLSPGALASGWTASPVDQLAKLADLRDRGVLTDAEFQAQKNAILGG